MLNCTFTKALSTLLCLFTAVHCAALPNKLSAKKTPANALQKHALLFTENKGQVIDNTGKSRPDILFTAHSSNANLYFTANGISYQFTKINAAGRSESHKERAKSIAGTHRFTMVLVGANSAPEVITEKKNAFTENFYLPHCTAGITAVATYARLVYKEVYPGIDWVIYSNNDALEYDFVVHDGGNPEQIKLRVDDANSVRITDKGELLMTTGLGEVREKAPVSYADGRKVKTTFRRNDDGTIGFDIAAHSGRTLRIDPAVTWATYFGGAGSEAPFIVAGGTNVAGLARDAAGNIYCAGTTTSATGIATGGAHQMTPGSSYDVYLAKYDPSGSILWATYYGGAGLDNLPNCATDPSGNVYLAGTTGTTTSAIATPGAHQTINAGNSPDAFLAKFNSAGVRLWGTYYGGLAQEGAAFCATDLSGNVYLCGTTQGSVSGIATPGAYMTAPATTASSPVDAFLAKFDGAGNLLWGTYYGGTGQETGIRCVADHSGNVYLAGITTSTSGISSSGTYQPAFGGGTNDAFLVRFDGSGARQWATYYGGTGADQPYLCTVDASDNLYLSGMTASVSGIATPGAHQPALGGSTDNFLTKFTPSGARLWATYYGGIAAESGGYCTVDNYNNVYLAGTAASPAAIASSGFQNAIGGSTDAYLAKFDSTGLRKWGTYFGNSGVELGLNCLADGQGSIYVTGTTTSATGIATTGAIQETYGGGTDAFLVRIADIRIITDTLLSGSPFCAGAAVSVPFTIEGTLTAFTPGNIFTAQLSDASGSFANPVNIGTYTGITAGTINAMIPVTTATGTGYRIRVISSSPAALGTDNKVPLTINASVIPSVTIAAAPGNIICAGTAVTFTATPVNGGAAPAFQWQKNGVNAGTNAATYTDNTLVNGDVVKVKLTSNAACPVPVSATSNNVLMTVNPAVIPAVTISANPGDTICAGTSVSFIATPVNGGAAPAYQWQKNGVNIGSNNAVYSDNALANGDAIKVTLISNAACASPVSANSPVINMKVNPVVTPSVTVSTTPATTICMGTTIMFTAMPVNEGTAPIYQWKKNGLNTGNNTANYTDNALANGDIITVALTSNAACANPATVAGNPINVTVNSILVPAVSITRSPAGAVCAATPVTFTAASSNGGATPAYRWQKNGTDIPGATSNTYTASSWADGDQVTVIMNSSAPCAAPAAATSNALTLAVTQPPAMPGAVNGNSSVCANSSNTYSIVAVPGATFYIWTLPVGWNGNSTNNSVTTTAGNNGGTITVSASNMCGTSANQNLAVAVNNVPEAPGLIIGPLTPCIGGAVTYTATLVSNATSYSWTLPNIWTGASATNTINATTGVTPGNITVAAVNICGSSASTALAVVPAGAPPQPSVITGSNNQCAGSSGTYSVTAVSGVTYNWSAPAGWTGSSNTNTITYVAGNTSGTISVTATGACGTSTASSRSVTVSPVLTPAITISAPGAICANAPATFIATPVNGGSTPAFQWNKNGLNVGLNATTYTDDQLSTGDVISAMLTSSANCVSAATATSNQLIITVTPSIVPGININATTPPDICSGTPVTFFSNIVGGGAAPVYTWRKNGVITGTNAATYTDHNLRSGDTIYAVLTSNAACASFTTVQSNKMGMTVSSEVKPAVSISASPGTTITPGQTVIFSATSANGGANPVYQWMKNNQPIAGANATSWAANNLEANDLITVMMTSSLPCASPAQVSSDELVIHSTTTGIPQQLNGNAAISLYPNPNTGHFTLEVNSNISPDGKRVYLNIVNHLGQPIYSTAVIPDTKKWSLNVVLGEEVANGIYLIKINGSQWESIKRFELKR